MRKVPDTIHVSRSEFFPCLYGPPKLGHLEVSIFNTRTYRPYAELEGLAKDRVVAAIIAKEGAALVQAAGAASAIHERVEVGPFWDESGSR